MLIRTLTPLVLLLATSACFSEPPGFESGTDGEEISSSADDEGASGDSRTSSNSGSGGSSSASSGQESGSSSDDESGDTGSSTGEDTDDDAGVDTDGETDGETDADTESHDPLEGMVEIPGGQFMMGCDTEVTDNVCHLDEFPSHVEELDPYAMDVYEVTADLYVECVEDGECEPADTFSYCNEPGEDKPANCVSWNDAHDYCSWRGKRLPTEAEWEFAAEGSLGNLWPWGQEPDATCDRVVMFGLGSPGCGSGGTLPVGSMSDVSDVGVHDLIGNVREWTGDWYAPDAYSQNSPPPTGTYRAIRGSHFGGTWPDTRLRARHSSTPSTRSGEVGFRCALSL